MFILFTEIIYKDVFLISNYTLSSKWDFNPRHYVTNLAICAVEYLPTLYIKWNDKNCSLLLFILTTANQCFNTLLLSHGGNGRCLLLHSLMMHEHQRELSMACVGTDGFIKGNIFYIFVPIISFIRLINISSLNDFCRI